MGDGQWATDHGTWLVLCVFLGSASLAWPVSALARRLDLVSRPTRDRWNRRVVALGGGVALAPPVLAAWLLLGDSLPLVLAGGLIFLTGLVDDVRGLSPPAKLVLQTIAGTLLVYSGAVLPLGVSPILAQFLTLTWFVGVCNALNLLDNMDGLAAGVAAIAAAFLAVLAASLPGLGPDVALRAAILCAGTTGFLLWNVPPAKIFMGDAGSLFLGFALAALVVDFGQLEAYNVSPQVGFWESLQGSVGILVPALILAVPIFDTSLVVVVRRLAGRSFLQGGRDHSSHRLVALGLSERQTIFLIYGVTAVTGLVAWTLRDSRSWLVIAASAAAVAVLLILLGLSLGRVAVYKAAGPAEATRSPRRTRLLFLTELLIDVLVLSAIWTFAHRLRFEPEAFADYKQHTVLRVLPILIALKIGAFLLFGLYRGIWLRLSLRDVVTFAKAAGLASLLLVFFAAIGFRLENVSREVIVVDGVLTFMGLLVTRGGLLALQRFFEGLARDPLRAIYVGTPALVPLLEGIARDEHQALELFGYVSPQESGDTALPWLGPWPGAKELLAQHKPGVILLGEGAEPGRDLAVELAQTGVLIRRVRLEIS